MSFLFGFVAAAIVIGVGVAFMLRKGDRDVPAGLKRGVNVAVVALAGLVLFAASPTLAQTPVPLEIPTNVIFTETNNWLATFAPIAAIGIGIAIALAVLGYLGKMITSAFRG